MKINIIKTLLIMLSLSISSAYADIYKCGILGVVIGYQDEPCRKSGLDGRRFRLSDDISKAEHQSAVKQSTADLKVYKKNKLMAQEYELRERMIRAKEMEAYAKIREANAAEHRVDVMAKNYFSSRLRNIYKSDRLVRLVPVSDYYYQDY